MIQSALAIVFLVTIAVLVPWTRLAAVAWFVSAPLLFLPALPALPAALRFATIALCAVWILVIWFPTRSPLGPLTRAEWACHEVIHGVSSGARSAYQAGTLTAQRATFIASLEALEPPNQLWRTVKTAQLLDLRADPPQVGVGDATDRLVSWPWRAALDHRIVHVRLWLDDRIRARRLRRNPLPGFDAMTTVMRYDYFFLRIVESRFRALQARDGGLGRSSEEASALLALAGEVGAPTAEWTRLRDLLVDIHRSEIKAATSDPDPTDRERMALAGDQARVLWVALERFDAQAVARQDV